MMIIPYGVPLYYNRTEQATKPTMSTFSLSISGASSDTRTKDSGWFTFTSVKLDAGDIITPVALDDDNNKAYFFFRIALSTGGEGYVPVTSTSFKWDAYVRNAATSAEVLAWSTTITTSNTHNVAIDTMEHPYASGSPQLNSSVTLDGRGAGGLWVAPQEISIDAIKFKSTTTVTWGAPVRYDHKYEDLGGSIGKCITFNHAADSYTPTMTVQQQVLENFYFHRFSQYTD